jgi:hypothetical protein
MLVRANAPEALVAGTSLDGTIAGLGSARLRLANQTEHGLHRLVKLSAMSKRHRATVINSMASPALSYTHRGVTQRRSVASSAVAGFNPASG